MKVLLTGATGYVGNFIGKDLVSKGHEVVALTRNKKKAWKSLAYPCKVIDLEDLKTIKGLEAVIHLAGASVAEKRWTKSYKKILRSSRVDFTQKIIETLDTSSLKVWLQASAIGYYEESCDSSGLEESAKKAEGFLADLVKDWEDSSRRLQVRKAYFRIGMVLGPRSHALETMLPLFRKGLGARLGSGRQYMPWVHVQDVSQAFLTALEEEAYEGVFNMVSPQKLTNQDFTQKLLKTIGARSLVPPAPALSLKLLYGEMSEILLKSLPVHPKKLIDKNFEFKFETVDCALEDSCTQLEPGERELHLEQWVPSPLEQTFEFFKTEKNLEILTPPFLKFKVLGKNTQKIESGTLIDYTLSLHGIPFKWRTEIGTWSPPHSFSDQQLKGPYKKWFHTHKFKSLGSGTHMVDHVIYKLPLGSLGNFVALWKVKKDVQMIFDYRQKKIKEIFG